MNENNGSWSVFWCQGASRFDPPSATALRTGKTVCEDFDVTRLDETVGLVIFEAGHGTIGGVEFEADLGAITVQGRDQRPALCLHLHHTLHLGADCRSRDDGRC